MSITLSHGDKVFFPDDNLTKQNIFDYYQRTSVTSAMILPYLYDSPVTFQRFSKGVGHEGFYQKRSDDHFPDSIATVTFPMKTRNEEITYMLSNDEVS